MKRKPFTLILKASIYKKYNFTCQRCKREWNGKERLFHIHHKDTNPTNNAPKNLILLCHLCHKSNYQIKKCLFCHRTIKVIKSYIGKRNFFCNRECYSKFIIKERENHLQGQQ